MKRIIRYIGSTAICLSFICCNNVENEVTTETTGLNEISPEIATVLPLDEKDHLIKTDGYVYSIKPRFSTIRKSELQKVTSFEDFIGKEHADRIVKYKRLNVILLDGDKKTDVQATGTSGQFNEQQLKLLRSFEHSTNIVLWADYDEKFDFSEDLYAETWTPHLTIVPEYEAYYLEGVDSLLSKIQEQSEELWSNIDTSNLKPAKIVFTIASDGTIKNMNLDNSCGYGHIDDEMKSLILESNGKWMPAKDINGNIVDQELVLSYGALGC